MDSSLTPSRFRARLRDGAKRIYGVSSYRGLSWQSLILAYRYAELCESGNFNPATHALMESLIAQSRKSDPAMEQLTRDLNLNLLMHSLDQLVAETAKQNKKAAERKEAGRDLAPTLRQLNSEIDRIFEGKIASFETSSRPENNRQTKKLAEAQMEEWLEKKRLERKEEDQKAHQRVLLFKKLVEAGRLIQAAKNAINNRSAAEIKDVIAQAAQGKVLSPAEAQKIIVRAVLNTLAASPDIIPVLVPGLLTELKDAYLNHHLAEIPGEPQLRLSIIKAVLSNLPQAIRYLIEAYARHYSWVKSLVNLIPGVQIKDIASKVFEPMILQAVQTIEGVNELLEHAFESLYTAGSLLSALRLGQFRLPKSAALQVARSVLAQNQDTVFPTFTNKSRMEEMQEIMVEIAKAVENNITTTNLNAGQANGLIILAAKIQRFIELLRGHNPAHASLLRGELHDLKGSRLVGSVRIPEFNLFTLYLMGQFGGSHTFVEIENQIAHRITAESNGNPISAIRVLRSRKEHAHIWQEFPKPELNDKSTSYARLSRYAYCFLLNAQAQKQESIKQDLIATLQQDENRKHLFLTLRYLPPTLKGEFYNYIKNFLAEIKHPPLVPELEIFQKLLNISDARAEAARIELAAQIVTTLQARGNGRIWGNIMSLMQSGNAGMVEIFLIDLIDNIKKKKRERNEPSINQAISALADAHPAVIPPHPALAAS
jgi:hypothetical protein